MIRISKETTLIKVMNIKLRRNRYETVVTFPNGKQLNFCLQDTKLLRSLIKQSTAIKWLCDRAAKLGEIDNRELPNLQSVDSQRHYFYICLKNAMFNLLDAEYTLDEVLQFEDLVLNGVPFSQLTEFAIASSVIKCQIAEAIKTRQMIAKYGL